MAERFAMEVNTWKLIAIVVSGLFGMLGIVTEFRNKDTGKPTKWGILALAGVVFASGVAITIQHKEADDAEKAKQKTADDTLAIVKNTAETLTKVEQA